MFFDNLVWLNDRMMLDGLVFRLQHHINDQWDLGDKCFIFYKIKSLVDQYAKFFESIPDFHVKNMVELGLWDGGSTAFWFETLRPQRYVGIDKIERDDSAYFKAYVASKGIADRVQTYWGTDQTNAEKLHSIVESGLAGSLNFVVDDASHLYGPTKRSFEILFPWMEPSGLYIVEDWAWSHWPTEFQAEWHPADETPLTKLVVDLIEACGSSLSGPGELVRSVTVFQGFAAVERGDARIAEPENLKLEDYICRKRAPTPTPRSFQRLKQLADRHVLWRFR